MSQQPTPPRKRTEASTFGRSKRLSGRADFERLFACGRAAREGWLLVKALPNGKGASRFGCAVRRQAAGRAVVRNRFKRWLREAFRRNPERFPRGMDWVAVVVGRPEEASFESFQEGLLALCGRLGDSFNRPSSEASGSIRG